MAINSIYNAVKSGDWVSFTRLCEGEMVKTYGYIVRVENLGCMKTARISFICGTCSLTGKDLIGVAEVPLGLVRLED